VHVGRLVQIDLEIAPRTIRTQDLTAISTTADRPEIHREPFTQVAAPANGAANERTVDDGAIHRRDAHLWTTMTTINPHSLEIMRRTAGGRATKGLTGGMK
jgi:hypothetical protein